MKDEHYFDREQSQVKHRVLERYLQAFSPIIGSKFDEIVYVDCMAGPWESKDQALHDTSFHTAISVLQECRIRNKCKRVRALLVESDPARFPLLEAYAKSVQGVEAVARNWEFTQHIGEIVAFAKESKNSFPFFFIDPTGWKEVAPNLLRPLLQTNPGEVLINFMTLWIKRFFDDPDKPFHELFGHAEVERLRRLPAEEREDEIVNVYAARIREQGRYSFTCAMPIMMPDRDEIHYHLVFGTRSFRGLEEFKEAEDVSIRFMHQLRASAQRRRALQATGQGFLLPALDMYYERRFGVLNQRRRENARAAVVEVLLRHRRALYSELYQEAMQFATVAEGDLREWLEVWNRAGQIRYLNWAKRQKVPHRDTVVEAIGAIS